MKNEEEGHSLNPHYTIFPFTEGRNLFEGK